MEIVMSDAINAVASNRYEVGYSSQSSVVRAASTKLARADFMRRAAN